MTVMYTTKYKGGHINVILTFTFKVSSQGEVNYFGDLVIPDPEKVRIDTKIQSVSCIQAKLKNDMKGSLTLTLKVNHQGQVTRDHSSFTKLSAVDSSTLKKV